MQKAVIAIVILIVVLPIALKLIPQPMTFDRIESGFTKAGLPVTNSAPVTPPLASAEEQHTMTIEDAQVDLYRYSDEGTIVQQQEYQKTDTGTVIVQSWNLSESLGAAKPKNKPVSVDRRGMFLLVVTSENGPLRTRILEAFRSL